MRRVFLLIGQIAFICHVGFSQNDSKGLRGNSYAIADAEAMVETMGGIEIWKQIKSLHFVHEWPCLPSFKM